MIAPARLPRSIVRLRWRVLLLLYNMAACSDRPTTTPAPGQPADSAEGSGGTDTAPGTPACDWDTAVREALAGDLCVSAAATCQWEGAQGYAYLGYALDAGGDLDGDGRAEVLLGAYLWDGGGGADQGMASVLWSQAPQAGPQTWLQGQQSGDGLGSAVALLGDVDGDGQGDALVGARGVDAPDAAEAGMVYVISGASGQVQATLAGERAYARAGIALAGGDLDGDGLVDLALTGSLKSLEGKADSEEESYASGRVALFYGGAGETWSQSTGLDQADAAVVASGTRDALGRALAAGADVDGDGYGDLVVGAPYAGGYRGQVGVLSGGATRWSGEIPAGGAQGVWLAGVESYGAFGWSVAVVDGDGDGRAEVLVGVPLADGTWGNEGAVQVYGDMGGSEGVLELQATLWGHEGDDQLGTTLAGGDVDGDGRAEVLVGAIQGRRGVLPLSGRLYLLADAMFAEGGDIPVDAVSRARVHGAAARDYLGSAAALADVNGDGRDDVVTASGNVNGETGGTDSGALYVLLAPAAEEPGQK